MGNDTLAILICPPFRINIGCDIPDGCAEKQTSIDINYIVVPEVDCRNDQRHAYGKEYPEETFVETPGHSQSEKGDGTVQRRESPPGGSRTNIHYSSGAV